METFRTRVSDRHDGCAGRTVVVMKVHRKCPLEDTYKKLETLRTRVSDNHDGCAGQTVVDVRQRTLRKSWRPLALGSLTAMKVVQDGPSC